MLAITKYIYLYLFAFLCLQVMHSAPEYHFKQISLRDGLSESMVKCVLTDHKGIVWIGTHLGLNSFDREKIKKYYHNKKNVYTIPDNNIHSLVEDSLLNLWTLTEKGLALYDREKDLFKPVLFNGNRVKAYSCVLVKDGLLFFGRGEFFKYNYSDRKIISLPIHTTNNLRIIFEKACAYTHSDSLILLASRWNGLWEYNVRTGYLCRSSFVEEYQIASLMVDSSDNLWLSPYGKGLVGYDCNKKEFCRLNAPRDLSNGIILDIKEREGKIWLATDGGGINIYDRENGSVNVINHVPGKPGSLPVSSFWCLYNDPDNNMWAGSIRGGLIGMKEIYMKTYQDVLLNSSYGLSEKVVVGMYEDKDHVIWLGTDGGGINRFDPQAGIFRHYPSTYLSKIVSIIDYSATELLVSSFGDGLYLFNKQTGKMKEYLVADTDKHNTLFRLGKSVNLYRLDERHFYLLGDSVYLYDQSSRKLTTVNADVKDAMYSSLNLIVKEKDISYLWGENDLFVLDHKRNKIQVLHSFEDSIGAIAAAAKDYKGDIWIGTSVGLYCFNPEKKTLTPIDDNRFLGTASLGFDRSGRLWIGTHNGLYAFMPDDGKIMMFGESDGVYANEYVTISPLITGTGDIFVPGLMGLVHIKNDLPFSENPDPVINLLDVILDGASAGLEVSRNDNTISVPWSYTSLMVKVIVRENDLMRKKLFRYYIKGKQGQMIESSNHTIALHALSVGTYEIWVSCNKKNGDWSPPAKLLTVEVTPPWWRTGWFFLCCIFVVASGLSVVFWLFMKRQEIRMIWAIREHEQQMYEEKIRFLINLNHELRTPLTLIYSPLKRLLHSGEINNTVHYRQLEGILKQTRRVKDIINMVLDVSRMEAGTEMLSIGAYNLNEWIRQVVDTFKEEFNHKDIKLEYRLDDLVDEVPFDAMKCEIILSNLIMNALKFSNTDTCITVSTCLMQDYVRVSVSDQGIGLENVDITRLFERFYQGTHNRQGTGIGLSYARMLVEMHGGRIGVDDKTAKGATFFYELPLINTAKSIAAKPYLNELLVSSEEKVDTNAGFSVRKYSVLIVEDEPDLRNFLKISMKEFFHQVYVAEDGVEGLDIAIRHLPDIIISDVVMPRMDGLEFCRLLKTNLEISHIPIILLTARTDQASTVQGYKEGADFYLPKPFSLEFLLAIVRNLLKNREAVKLRYKEGKETVSPKEDTISNADEQFMKKLNDLIKEQLQNPKLDVNFVATQMAMSRASLYNKLKALTGVSIGDYINKFRMACVMELLADKELSLWEISDKAGFSNQRYFSTVFKQTYGTTPSKYRQEHFS